MHRRLLALFTSLIFIIVSIPFFQNTSVHAAASTPLNEVTALTGGDLDAKLTIRGVDLTDNSEVNYGDTIVCTLNWKLPNNDIFQINAGDSFTYELPENMDFVGKSGDIMDGNQKLGTYLISGHTITLTYTDKDFCAQEDRIGHLSFYGSIEVDPKISFTGARDITLLVGKKPVDSKLDVDKVFHIENNANHIYSCLIPITATGEQTNIQVVDTMWPGMSLYNTPKVYTDKNHTSEFTDCSAFADDGGDGQTFTGTIYHMDDGQTLYLYYLVQVREEMFDRQRAEEFISQNHYDTPGNYYEDGYPGTIPNRVTVSSTQAKTPVNRTTNIYGSGYNMEKWRAESETDPSTGIDQLELGYIRWQLFLNPIKKSTINSGYIIDTIPDNSSVDEASFFFHDSYWNRLNMAEYISYKIYEEGGSTRIRFDFKPELIAELKSRNEGLYIEYRTHMDRQETEKHEFVNEATLYYEGEDPETRRARWLNTKPSELQKYVAYEAPIAPYAEYTIVVNPMAMDLDPNSTKLALSDTMGSALDVDLESITLNDQPAEAGSVSFDPDSHTFTLTLNDSTRYTVKYRARVNLVAGETLNESNSENTCKLVGVITSGNENSAVIKGKVLESAASSSSNIGYGTFNIVKHDKDSTGTLLSGATFRISSAVLSGQTVTSTSSIGTKNTDRNGKATFTSLVRGTLYQFVETSAPDDYELDDTPFFVIFAETSTSTYPSTVSYNGTDYPVMVVDFSHYSADKYVSNERTPVTPNPPAPTTPTTPSNPTTPTTPSTPGTPTTPSTPTEPTTSTTPATTADPTTAADPTTTSEPAATTEAPQEPTSAPASTDPQEPSESTTDVEVADAQRKIVSEEPTTTTTASSEEKPGGIVKTGETVSFLAVIGASMLGISFLAVLLLQKKDRKIEE